MSAAEKTPTTVDLSKYIDFKHFGERPHIRGRKVLVTFIVAAAEGNGWTVAETAYQYTLSEEEVLAAMLYYREHKDELDAQDAEEQRLFDEMYQLYGDHSSEDQK
jgi:uncharacterized protein (DUF433 family)